MNQKIINLIAFTAGAAIGSLVTWRVMKTRCEQIIQNEVDAFKEDWADMARESKADYEIDTGDTDDDEMEEEDEEDSDFAHYRQLALDYEEKGGEDWVPYINGPYVITPEEFGDGNFGHDLHCITYYADGVLADDWDVKLDIEETIGEEALEHFGDYQDDVVHVRNERLQCDYEVTCDPRDYADVSRRDPSAMR